MANERLLSCPIPTDINPLSPNGFMFSIARLPKLTYFCQEVNLPIISLDSPDMRTPFSSLPLAGDVLVFGELQVQFLIDSDFSNYKSMFNWLNGLGFPDSNDQYIEQIQPTVTSPLSLPPQAASTSDATLSVLNNHNNVVQTIKFIDCIPTGLESVTFTSTSQDVQYLIGNASFKYARYYFE